MTQQTLQLFKPGTEKENVEFLVNLLEGRDWVMARELIQEINELTGRKVTDRCVRGWAEMSEGRIGSGQRGYKLIRAMTSEEYNHYRNWMTHQADRMRSRIIKSDRVFYGRKPI